MAIKALLVMISNDVKLPCNYFKLLSAKTSIMAAYQLCMYSKL